jgi:hypothetical protein
VKRQGSSSARGSERHVQRVGDVLGPHRATQLPAYLGHVDVIMPIPIPICPRHRERVVRMSEGCEQTEWPGIIRTGKVVDLADRLETNLIVKVELDRGTTAQPAPDRNIGTSYRLDFLLWFAVFEIEVRISSLQS